MRASNAGVHPGTGAGPGPETGDQLYSIRISRSARALACLNDGPALVLVTLYVRHDEAYRGNR